jgi:S1-C subfamily serine protease
MNTKVMWATVLGLMVTGSTAWASDSGAMKQLDRAVDALEAGDRWTAREAKVRKALARGHAAAVSVAGSSGVNLSRDGLVLTAWHAVEDRAGKKLKVRFPDGRVATGRVTTYSRAENLALIALEGGGFPAATLAAKAPGARAPVWVVGTPRRDSGAGAFHTSFGRVRAGSGGQIAYDAWTYWGHGGAPVFDAAGRVVGVHTSWDARTRLRMGRSLSSVAGFLEAAGESRLVPGEVAPTRTLAAPDYTITKAHLRQLQGAINGLEAGERWTGREEAIERAIVPAHAASVHVGGGSGMILTPDGLLMTAYHVVDHDPRGAFRVRFPNGQKFDARVVAVSPEDDLALLRLPAPTTRAYPHVEVAAREPSVGDDVIVIGNPGAKSGRGKFHTSVGQVLWYGPRRGILGDLAYDAWTYWGHSGGPVYNTRGELVGVHNSWDSNNAWRHGLRLSTVRAFLDRHAPGVL